MQQIKKGKYWTATGQTSILKGNEYHLKLQELRKLFMQEFVLLQLERLTVRRQLNMSASSV